MYRYLSETLLSIWGGIYQEVELVDHMAVAFFIVGGQRQAWAAGAAEWLWGGQRAQSWSPGADL